jgi:predicted amidohydrolase
MIRFQVTIIIIFGLFLIQFTKPCRSEGKMTHEITIATISVSTLEGAFESNYDRAFRLCKIALFSKPDIILLPETFAAGYCSTDLLPYAETQESPYLRKFQDLSRDCKCMIVLGYLEKCPNGIKNAVVIFDSGTVVGRHYKKTLWVDDDRPYRDERTLMIPGDAVEVFDTRFGKFAVVICYENIVQENWQGVAPKVDFIISPYNCEQNPTEYNISKSKQYGVPSFWADRTGTVFAGGNKYVPNMGTAGIVDSKGNVIAQTSPGIEEIIIGKLILDKGVNQK